MSERLSRRARYRTRCVPEGKRTACKPPSSLADSAPTMETLLRAASPESVSIVLRASPTAALRSMAKTAAAEGLPLELERLGSGGQRELAVRYETEPDELVGVLTERHIDGLLNPLGTATSKLQVTTPASEGRIIADLYWRCCIAMQMSARASRTAPACSRAAAVVCVCAHAFGQLGAPVEEPPPAGSATCFAQGASQAPPRPAAALAGG